MKVDDDDNDGDDFCKKALKKEMIENGKMQDLWMMMMMMIHDEKGI